MSNLFKAFLVVAAIVFALTFTTTENRQAAVFEGTVTNTGEEVGYCLTNPDEPSCNCDAPSAASDIRCMTEAEAGTGIAKGSLASTGLTHTENFGDLIKKYVNFILPYLVLAAFLGYVVAGIIYVTALGNDEQIQKAKKILVWTSIGLIVVILSYAIVQFLTSDLIKSLAT